MRDHYMGETEVPYRERMVELPQFMRFRHAQPTVVPKWQPGSWDIEAFCHDEVVRQGHDPRVRSDGGLRIQWMRNAWEYALNASYHVPQRQDIITLGNLVEPETNARGFRVDGVWIGGRPGSPWGLIPSLVDRLCGLAHVSPGPAPDDYVAAMTEAAADEMLVEFWEMTVQTVDEWYLAYEFIHPFGDGNGRSGKVLHNWLNGTLEAPVLVPDYFGGGNP